MLKQMEETDTQGESDCLKNCKIALSVVPFEGHPMYGVWNNDQLYVQKTVQQSNQCEQY